MGRHTHPKGSGAKRGKGRRGTEALKEFLQMEQARSLARSLLAESKAALRRRRGRISEDQVLAVLRVAEEHGLIRDLRQAQPFSKEDLAGIDICFADNAGAHLLQVKTSYYAARRFSAKQKDIPVVWISGGEALATARRLAELFPSLRTLSDLIERRG